MHAYWAPWLGNADGHARELEWRSVVRSGWAYLTRAGLALPFERGIVAVVIAAGVVPVDAEGVQVTARAVGECQLGADWMADVFEIHRLGAVGARHSFDGLVQEIWNGDRSPIAVGLNSDGP